MSLEAFRNRCPAIDELIERLIELELPLPSDASMEEGLIAVSWSSTGLIFWFEPDARHCGVIDELDAALIKGLDPDDWPHPSADGYAEYRPA